MDMLHGLSESRTRVNGAKKKLQHFPGEPTIDERAAESDHLDHGLATDAALVEAEIVLADLRQAKELPA